ncbi:uncharacterized protein LOC127584148 [Pristis pectinata]|uniref:uncharacterized protein LOC127584148 n=1 Tax=Pristis pectinata TaxID=685728 RepID=UPI00223CE140|nr:uncharacterized protein LOC127584148 [Pristis pectinata]
MLRVPKKRRKMFTTTFYTFWAMNCVWLDILLVPVTGLSTADDGTQEDSIPLQAYLIVALVLLVMVLLVCLAAIIGVALIYFKLSQIQKMLSEKDDETYAQIGTNLAHFTRVRKDLDLISTGGNMKGNNGIVETGNEYDREKRPNKCPYLKLPDGMVQAISLEFPKEAKIDTESTKHYKGARGTGQLTENIPKYSPPSSYNSASRNSSQRELNNPQRNILQQSKESQAFSHAANNDSIITQANQKAAKKLKVQPAANIPEPSSLDSSTYAIYDVPRPCSCSSMCHGVSWPSPASDFQHNPLKRSLSEIGPSAFEIPLEMVQDNKYAVPRPVTFPSHGNYETEFKDLEKSSSKDSGVLSYVDSQLLDLIPEGNEPHLESKNNLENKQRQVADKESVEDKSVFI